MEQPYPIRLEEAPIVEAIVEIRFNSSLPADAVFGIIYAQLQENYPSHKQLPIMQLPDEIRKKEINLIYQAYYQLTGSGPLVIGIGPRVISIGFAKYNVNNIVDYPGWTNHMADEASRVIKLALDSLPSINVERLGIRYQDFFKDMNLVDGSQINFNFARRKTKSLMVKTSIQENDMLHGITISDNANINIQNEGQVRIEFGSLLDIDTSINDFEVDTLSEIKSLLTRVHDANKNLFYEILKKDFVDNLGAVYPTT